MRNCSRPSSLRFSLAFNYYAQCARRGGRRNPGNEARSHHALRSEHDPELVASSAYQTCCTVGKLCCSWWIIDRVASAYMAIARGSPWMVPSVDEISPLPAMIILTGALYVLIRICFRGGHSTLTLCRAALGFRMLGDFAHCMYCCLTSSGLTSTNLQGPCCILYIMANDA